MSFVVERVKKKRKCRVALSIAIENDRANDQDTQLRISHNGRALKVLAQDVIERLVLFFSDAPSRRAALKLLHTNAGCGLPVAAARLHESQAGGVTTSFQHAPAVCATAGAL
jgi:hypothetical protein